MIRAVKPTKMLVLNLNARLFALIAITVFIAPPFVTKMNVNDVLCKKNPSLFELHAAVSSVHKTDSASNPSA